MAPIIDKEAEHIRTKARKDLLELLEGVRDTNDGFCSECPG
jgi:hypothetical protein